MRAVSSAVSITVHLAVGAALLLGSAKRGRSDPARPLERRIFFEPVQRVDEQNARGGPSVPAPITVEPPDLHGILRPALSQPGATMPSFLPVSSTASTIGAGQPGGWSGLLSGQPAEMLTSPLPVYPDLLRQAGVQGRVVLEAIVDTTGRVLASSILLVSATHPAFVAPARQALLASLFRPGLAGGKPVRMRVRIPYDFTIRTGMGRAR
jgi:TonB family protein